MINMRMGFKGLKSTLVCQLTQSGCASSTFQSYLSKNLLFLLYIFFTLTMRNDVYLSVRKHLVCTNHDNVYWFVC